MSCDCLIEVDCHDDDPVLYAETYPRARKEHRCSECGVVIERREKYCRSSGLWDGRFETYKTCMVCDDIRQTLFCGGVFGDMLADVREYIVDSDGQISSDCLLSMSPGARFKVIVMIDRYWTEQDAILAARPKRS